MIPTLPYKNQRLCGVHLTLCLVEIFAVSDYGGPGPEQGC